MTKQPPERHKRTWLPTDWDQWEGLWRQLHDLAHDAPNHPSRPLIEEVEDAEKIIADIRTCLIPPSPRRFKEG